MNRLVAEFNTRKAMQLFTMIALAAGGVVSCAKALPPEEPQIVTVTVPVVATDSAYESLALTATADREYQDDIEQEFGALIKTATASVPPTPVPWTATPSVPPIYADKPEGSYLVGVDIAPGIWRSRGSENCAITIKNLDGSLKDIQFDPPGSTFRVPEGQYNVVLQFDCIWSFLQP